MPPWETYYLSLWKDSVLYVSPTAALGQQVRFRSLDSPDPDSFTTEILLPMSWSLFEKWWFGEKYPHNGILLSNELLTWNNLDESQKRDEKSKKPVSKGYMLFDSIYVIFLNNKTTVMENRSVIARVKALVMVTWIYYTRFKIQSTVLQKKK